MRRARGWQHDVLVKAGAVGRDQPVAGLQVDDNDRELQEHHPEERGQRNADGAQRPRRCAQEGVTGAHVRDRRSEADAHGERKREHHHQGTARERDCQDFSHAHVGEGVRGAQQHV